MGEFPHAVSAGEPATEQQPRGGAPALRAFRLTVIEGLDEGKSFVVDPRAPQRTYVGTSPACEIRLNDRAISRRHAALDLSGTRCRITDLGSTNGTLVDGVTVVEALLRGREIVRLGGTALRIEGEDAAPSASIAADGFGALFGASAAMQRLYPLLERLATTQMPVLIEGEPGTGKELLAESLHEASGLSGPFLVLDCATTPAERAEAALFGQPADPARGTPERAGAFEQAHQGTLLVDEIGDLDLALQAKLLRAIERGEVRRAGGAQIARVKVRVIATTRRDLEREVAERCFHEELLRRVSLARVVLPPLRERHGDIAPLARRFAEQMGAPPDLLSAEILTRFERYPWPGNVRELYNAVAQRFLLGDSPLEGGDGRSSRPAVAAGDDLAGIDRMIEEGVPFPIARRRVLDAFMKRYVERILERYQGSVAKASAASGIGRRYFQIVKARTQSG